MTPIPRQPTYVPEFVAAAANQLIHKPPAISNLLFTGKSSELERFLMMIQQTICTQKSSFQDNKAMINWIALHFISPDKKPTQTYNWFTGILQPNAFEQGFENLDEYFEVFLPVYTFIPLASVANFINAMIEVYGKKDSAGSSQKELNACVQGTSSIVDYNLHFLAVCFNISLTENSQIVAYIRGLHPNILAICSLNMEWPLAATLEKWMSITMAASFSLAENELLPANHLMNFTNQCSNAQHQCSNNHHLMPPSFMPIIPVPQEPITPLWLPRALPYPHQSFS
ncbi:hypothetical protein CROQUDRAFT_44510 [Cronartium quercuum f. sp. fusiforme G11]|uniref:Uncharacterized protein n=1 Tax=Cronartium quercuum f. sp. fusiforme G11 TaxID=708437 RepID=A0A9P6NIQ2_9BASI|nr:hypothetical protein CROQUDRAFT_44510 [Cronartium quercuum f. sp. fusiforme G11]